MHRETITGPAAWQSAAREALGVCPRLGGFESPSRRSNWPAAGNVWVKCPDLCEHRREKLARRALETLAALDSEHLPSCQGLGVFGVVAFSSRPKHAAHLMATLTLRGFTDNRRT